MTASRRAILALVALLAVPSCADNVTAPSNLDSIAGTYALTTVDGQPLPFSSAPDSTGTVTTITGGTLVLGNAAPGEFAATPAGWDIPKSCIHEIPDGAWVDDTHGDTVIVHLPDSTSYTLPLCGDGPYALLLNRQVRHAGGGPAAADTTMSGLYAWGPAPFGDGTEIALEGSGLAGQVTTSRAGVEIQIAARYLFMKRPPDYHIYGFTGPGN
jgi:hypothetical protein